MTDYRSAGVDTVQAANFIRSVAPLMRKTARKGSEADVGGFGGMFDLKACGFNDPLLVAATDGVGTKLKLAIDSAKHDTIGIDLVAMCVNDLIVQGAEPLFFLDYFAQGQLLPAQDMQAIVSGIVEGCLQAGCALIGGETAEMPGMYQDGDYDLAGFTVGAVERDQVICPDQLSKGDTLIALASSGFHSNGYSLIRKVIKDMDANQPAPFAAQAHNHPSLYEALLTPTRIYIPTLLPLVKSRKINAMWHITGGGFYENLERGLADNLSVLIDQTWNMPECFTWLAQTGNISSRDMFSTFNCGVGMVIACNPNEAKFLCDAVDGTVLGHITERQNPTEPVVLAQQILSQFP